MDAQPLLSVIIVVLIKRGSILRISKTIRLFRRFKRRAPSLVVDTIDVMHRLINFGCSLNYPYTSSVDGYSPFFIIGCGRSGNTLLRKLLLEKATVVIPPEIPGLGGTIRKFSQTASKDWPDVVDSVLTKFLKLSDVTIESSGANGLIRYNLVSELGIDFCKLRNRLINLNGCDRSLASIISSIYETYSTRIHGQVLPWGDKTPWNVFHYERIKKVFPKAKYIHMLRDGRACVSSYLLSLGKEKNITLADAAHRWTDSVNKCLKIQRIEGNRFITVRYENLVAAPDLELNRVFDFLCLDRKTEKDYKLVLGDEHLSHHSNLAKPISSLSLDKWKRNLSENNLREINKIMNKTLIRAGYS